MTGAKLLGMHESVSSPTRVTISACQAFACCSRWCRRRVAELCGRCVEGNLRPIPPLRVGIAHWG